MSADRSATGATILVVDDTPESLRFLTTTLEQAGMTVLIAVDGLAVDIGVGFDAAVGAASRSHAPVTQDSAPSRQSMCDRMRGAAAA